MNQWQIGDVTITRVVELETTGGTRFILPDASPEAVKPIEWLHPHFMNEAGKLIMSIHALIVETPTHRMIVDTCLGNDKKRNIPAWNMLQSSFLEDISKAGYARETIDTVLCTHLHVDHVGWNTMWVGERWLPTFPHARYLLGKKEWEYWSNEEAHQDYGDVMEDSVRPVFEAGLVELVEMDHKVCDEVWLEPTTGHTPGHVSVRISSKGKEALITGDCIHHPCQMARLDWGSTADYNPEAARKTRHSLCERYANTPTLIIGTHFATPTAGYLVRDGESYRLDVLE